jgi:hypothetical protein
MPWATTRKAGTDPKYQTAEHRNLRAALVRRIKAGEALDCTAKVCVLNRAPITNPNGNAPDGLHLGHEDDGITYAGPQHRACNVKDGARRGNARARGAGGNLVRRWVL